MGLNENKMAEIPEGGFTEREQLEAWLIDLPDEQTVVFARVIASRCALRVLPNVYDVKAQKNDNIVALQYAIRANIVAHFASTNFRFC